MARARRRLALLLVPSPRPVQHLAVGGILRLAELVAIPAGSVAGRPEPAALLAYNVRKAMPIKPSSNEEEYFIRKEAERLRRLAEEHREKTAMEDRERERALHFMRCPKCGMQLQEIAFGDVRVDKCFGCEGMWLDKGELDVLRTKEAGFIDRLMNVFRQG